MKPFSVTSQMKAIEQYFPVVLFAFSTLHIAFGIFNSFELEM